MMDPDEVLHDRHERLHATIKSVKKETRGLPPDRAEALLTVALRRHDAYLGKHSVRVLARQMSNPWWALRHPLRARRLMRGVGDEPDQESAHLEAESEELSRRLEGVYFHPVERMTIDSRRTLDGVAYTVSVEPWSAEAAKRIRALAHPIPVTVLRWDTAE